MNRDISLAGLKRTDLEKLSEVFRRHPAVEKAVLYGSRAIGNFRPFSDVDITLLGEGISGSEFNRLFLDIDDLMLPYNFDLSLFSSLSNPRLREHIARVGIIIYEKSDNP